MMKAAARYIFGPFLLPILVVLNGVSLSKSSDSVCATAPYPALSAATTIFNDKAEFTCSNKQKGNIPALAKMGRHIVSIQQQGESNPTNPNPTAVTILILEKIAK